jgi:hypothetical protein
VLVLAGAALIALISARDYAGGWNDGSRLATVETLVDYHTLAIDRSIFVAAAGMTAASPYPKDDPDLQFGTLDKLWIEGHFYSDKSPVPALLLAGVYEGLQAASGLTARTRPDRFIYWMTLCSSGLAYVVAVYCILELALALGLQTALCLALTGSFAFTTLALPYSRHVNNHILLLGVMAPLLLGLVRLQLRPPEGRRLWLLPAGLGGLAGLAYTIDLGAGPVLLACTSCLVLWRTRTLVAGVAFAAMALPWLMLHHAFNYAVGGTFKPANAVPEYFLWPGCPFAANTLTGGWHHGTVGSFLLYAGSLLFGRRGFVGHDLVLFLVFPAFGWLLRKKAAERPEVLYAGACCLGVWLVYAITSSNSSGLCCSIRWFVPLLVPAFFVLALCLRDEPRFRGPFYLLSGWGGVLAVQMWWQGPWMKHLVPFFWLTQIAALASLILYGCWVRIRAGGRMPERDTRHEPLGQAA